MVTRKRCTLCNHEQRDQFEEDLESMAISPDELDKRMEWASGTSARHQRNHMSGYHLILDVRFVLLRFVLI